MNVRCVWMRMRCGARRTFKGPTSLDRHHPNATGRTHVHNGWTSSVANWPASPQSALRMTNGESWMHVFSTSSIQLDLKFIQPQSIAW
jgi:hypothetical protein